MKRFKLINGSLKRKEDEDMSTLTLDNISFKDFISKNKEKAYKIARENTTYNSEGKATISKEDPWVNEREWDELYKDVNK